MRGQGAPAASEDAHIGIALRCSQIQANQHAAKRGPITEVASTILKMESPQDVDERYRFAANHSIHMPIDDAEVLSRTLARRIELELGRPDLLVGIANGAVLTLTVSGSELNIPTRIVRVRRASSTYKRKLLAIKEALHIPSRWVLAGPLRYFWTKFQERHANLQEDGGSFDFDVRGLHVTVIDDCVVSGNSLEYVAEKLRAKGAKRVTTAVLCCTEPEWGGTAAQLPDVFLHRKIQWYPWSNNSDHWPQYQVWLNANGLEQWK